MAKNIQIMAIAFACTLFILCGFSDGSSFQESSSEANKSSSKRRSKPHPFQSFDEILGTIKSPEKNANSAADIHSNLQSPMKQAFSMIIPTTNIIFPAWRNGKHIMRTVEGPTETIQVPEYYLWNYDVNNDEDALLGVAGPSNWYTIKGFEGCEKNKCFKSPVDIQTSKVQSSNEYQLKFVNYLITSKNVKIEVINDEHTVHVRITYKDGTKINEKPYLMTIKCMKEQYEWILGDIVFHWGNKEDMRGSAHTVNAYRAFVEAEFIHFDSKYTNLEEAKENVFGVSIVSILFCLRNSNNQLNDLLFYIEKATTPDIAPIQVDLPFDLNDWLPSDLDSFFYYPGSFMTPPCQAPVHRYIFNNMDGISYEQINVFLNLETIVADFMKIPDEKKGKNTKGKVKQTYKKIVNNYRPIQSLDNNKIIKINRNLDAKVAAIKIN